MTASLCSSSDCASGCQPLSSSSISSCTSLSLPGLPGRYALAAGCQLSGLSIGLIVVGVILLLVILLYNCYKWLDECVRTCCITDKIIYVEVPPDSSSKARVAEYKERLKESQRRVQELQWRMEGRLAEMDRQALLARAPGAARSTPRPAALDSRGDSGLGDPLLGGADYADSS